MKRYPLRYLIFLSPFLVAVMVELMLPVDFFTHRLWEALLVRESFGILPGPFYTGMEVRKIEQGDLAHHTPYTTIKNVEWFTDRYGYRKKDGDLHPRGIVIIGDSNTAGSGLTQEDMLSEVLQARLGINVYPLAPAGASRYTKHRFFQKHPPAIVILASIERNIVHLGEPKTRSFTPDRDFFTNLHYKLQRNRILQKGAQIFDRINKGNMLNFFRASIGRIWSPPPKCVAVEEKCFLFLQGPAANKDVSPAAFEATVRTIKRFSDIFRARGIRFIFLPIPNKETIYYEYLKTAKPGFLGRLDTRLRELGIESIDTQPAFEDAFQKHSMQLFYSDDTHWNRHGVRIAADLVSTYLDRKDAGGRDNNGATFR
jgi:alginate O-acetyltransferase complex protein AlgJ